jgi:hypothetical protein
MPQAENQTSFNSLEEFLDTLPIRPCPATPQNRYYCTVCERLNKSIAARCDYSKVNPGTELGAGGASAESPPKFLPLTGDDGTPGETPESMSADDKAGKVEFKVVTPDKTEKDYPLFEFVQPKDKKIQPIEMELLEDVAIEFEVSNDEPLEVEAMEVEPLDEDDDETGDVIGDDDVTEVEVAEVVEVDELTSDGLDSGDELMEFKPLGTPGGSTIPSKKPKVTRKPIAKPRRVAQKPASKKLKPVVKKAGPVKKSVKPVTPRPKSFKPKKVPKTTTSQPSWTPPGDDMAQPRSPIESTTRPPSRIQPVQPFPSQQVPPLATQPSPEVVKKPKKVVYTIRKVARKKI